MPTCECCVFVDIGVCVGVGPSMSTRGILGKIWHSFIYLKYMDEIYIFKD